MTDITAEEQPEPPSRKLDLSKLEKQAIPFDTDNLGQLLLGRFTMGAIIKLSPSLDADSGVDDHALVLQLLMAVATLPSSSSDGKRVPLDEAAAAPLTENDLVRFAKAFMEREEWVPDDEDGVDDSRWIRSLAKHVRRTVRELGESTRKLMEGVKGVLTPSTQKLFMTSAALSERLKELGGASSALKNAISAAVHKNPALFVRGKTPDIPDLIRTAPDSLKRIRTTDALNHPSLPRMRIPGDDDVPTRPLAPAVDFKKTPPHRTAVAVEEMNEKMEEIFGIAKEMAVAHGSIHELLTTTSVQFEEKRIADTKDIKRNTKIAMVSLALSVAIGLLALVFSYLSFDVADKAYKLQSDGDPAQREQLDTLKELVKALKEENTANRERLNRLERADVSGNSRSK
jgi:hypothetical protein